MGKCKCTLVTTKHTPPQASDRPGEAGTTSRLVLVLVVLVVDVVEDDVVVGGCDGVVHRTVEPHGSPRWLSTSTP